MKDDEPSSACVVDIPTFIQKEEEKGTTRTMKPGCVSAGLCVFGSPEGG
jgi:hypothetical protein